MNPDSSDRDSRRIGDSVLARFYRAKDEILTFKFSDIRPDTAKQTPNEDFDAAMRGFSLLRDWMSSFSEDEETLPIAIEAMHQIKSHVDIYLSQKQ